MIAPTFAHDKCPNHPDSPQLGYMGACADAERRMKRREQQWCCGRCDRWIWAEFMVDFSGARSEGWWKRIIKETEKRNRGDSGSIK